MCQQDKRLRKRHPSKSAPKDADEDLFSLFQFSREKQDEYSVAYERTIFAHNQRRYSHADNTRQHSRLQCLRPLPASNREDEEQDMFSMFSWSRATQDEARIFEARTSFTESEIRFTKKRQAPVCITGWYLIEEHFFPIVPLIPYAVPPKPNSSKTFSMPFALNSSNNEENSRSSFSEFPHKSLSSRHSLGFQTEAALEVQRKSVQRPPILLFLDEARAALKRPGQPIQGMGYFLLMT